MKRDEASAWRRFRESGCLGANRLSGDGIGWGLCILPYGPGLFQLRRGSCAEAGRTRAQTHAQTHARLQLWLTAE
jgi:hypothetical protein